MKKLAFIIISVNLFLFVNAQNKDERIIHSFIEEMGNYDLEQFKNWQIESRNEYSFICRYVSDNSDSVIYRCFVSRTKKGVFLVQEAEPVRDRGQLPFDEKFFDENTDYPFNPESLKRLLLIITDYKFSNVRYSYKSSSIFFNKSGFALKYYYGGNADPEFIKKFNYKKIDECWYYKI